MLNEKHNEDCYEKNYGIVHSGGAFGCAFGVSIEYELAHHFRFPPPKIRLASSGGVINESLASASQHAEGLEMLKDKFSHPSLVSTPVLREGEFVKRVKINQIIEEVRKILDFDRLVASPTNTIVAATECKSGDPHFFDSHSFHTWEREDWLTCMTASSAIPGHHPHVQINGTEYMDGDVGISLSSLIVKAFSYDIDWLIVINNRSQRELFNSNTLIDVGSMVMDSNFRNALKKRWEKTKTDEAALKAHKKNIVYFSPSSPLPTRGLNNTPWAIEECIRKGTAESRRGGVLWKLRDDLVGHMEF